MRTVCPCCHRSLPKKRVRKVVKKSVRKYEDGIKRYPDGREICLTKMAKGARLKEVWKRDEGMCQYPLTPGVGVNNNDGVFVCGIPVMPLWKNLHHLRKRSVGRDDRPQNLTLRCEHHHIFHEHDEFKKVKSTPLWSKRA